MENSKLPVVTVEEGIACIRLNDPATFNGLRPETFEFLHETLLELTRQAALPERVVRAVVLTGTGKGFCTGAELGGMAALAGQDEDVGLHLSRWVREKGMHMMMALNELPVPLVVAINGVTAGIGMSIALRGDVVLAARSASFVVPFLTGLGILPDGGLTWQLPRLVGQARARAMCLLGDRMTAEEAVQAGLIWRCCDDDALMSEAIATARRLASLPSYACRELRDAFSKSDHNDYVDQFDYELKRNDVLLRGAAFREGVGAFLSRRKPDFNV